MKKLLVLLIACLCLIACEERKPVKKIITGTIVNYEHHAVLSDKALIKCDDGTFYILSDENTNEQTFDGAFTKYLYNNKTHIKLTINISGYGYEEVIKIEQL